MPTGVQTFLLLTVVAAGCAGTYPSTDTAQEAMARGDGPIKSMGDPPGANDPGVVTGRLEPIATFAPAGPMAFESVVLTRGGVVVARTTSDAHGGFMFVGIKQAGVYEASVASDRLSGSARFSINPVTHVSGLRLSVRPIAAANR